MISDEFLGVNSPSKAGSEALVSGVISEGKKPGWSRGFTVSISYSLSVKILR